MTTATPRVRVTYDGAEAQFVTTCGGCHKTLPLRRFLLRGALADAHRHAQKCDSIRLAALLARLEGLRDGFERRARQVDGSLLPPISVERRILQAAAADLDVIIREAGR